MNIEKLIGEIIPPSDYQHRNGFNNIPLIDKLTDNEKRQVEDALIYKLLYEIDQEIDTLVVETLVYLKSKKSLPVLKELLENCKDEMIKLKIATSIFELNHDNEMINIAVSTIKKIDNDKDPYYIYKLTSAFYYLAKFRNVNINAIIKEYTKHKEYLISYNAKQALLAEGD